MKVVINNCYGGFGLSDEACKFLGVEYAFAIEDDRTNEKLIEAVEKFGDAVNGSCSDLKIVDIPDEATDWELQEYDGIESIICVVDGKINHLW
jgi:hypothetical protein